MQRPYFPKRNSNFNLSSHRAVFHFASVHFRWALVQRRQPGFWIMLTYSFFFNLHLWMAQQNVFTDSYFWNVSEPCSDFHARFMSVFHAEPKDLRDPILIFGVVLCAESLLQPPRIFWWWNIQSLFYAHHITDQLPILLTKCSSGWCVPFIKFTMRKYFKHLIYFVCSIIAFFLYWHFIQCANSFGTGFADFVKNINFMINIHVSSVTSVSVSQIKFQRPLSVSQSTSTLLENVAEGRTVDTDTHGE